MWPWAGVGIIVAMVVTAVALRIARTVITDRIEVDVRRQAVESLWGRLFETLFQQTAALTALGLVIALGAWLAGPARLAVRLRSRVTSRGAGGASEPRPSPRASPDYSAPTAPVCAWASSRSPPESSSCCPDRAR